MVKNTTPPDPASVVATALSAVEGHDAAQRNLEKLRGRHRAVREEIPAAHEKLLALAARTSPETGDAAVAALLVGAPAAVAVAEEGGESAADIHGRLARLDIEEAKLRKAIDRQEGIVHELRNRAAPAVVAALRPEFDRLEKDAAARLAKAADALDALRAFQAEVQRTGFGAASAFHPRVPAHDVRPMLERIEDAIGRRVPA